MPDAVPRESDCHRRRTEGRTTSAVGRLDRLSARRRDRLRATAPRRVGTANRRWVATAHLLASPGPGRGRRRPGSRDADTRRLRRRPDQSRRHPARRAARGFLFAGGLSGDDARKCPDPPSSGVAPASRTAKRAPGSERGGNPAIRGLRAPPAAEGGRRSAGFGGERDTERSKARAAARGSRGEDPTAGRPGRAPASACNAASSERQLRGRAHARRVIVGPSRDPVGLAGAADSIARPAGRLAAGPCVGGKRAGGDPVPLDRFQDHLGAEQGKLHDIGRDRPTRWMADRPDGLSHGRKRKRRDRKPVAQLQADHAAAGIRSPFQSLPRRALIADGRMRPA